GCVQLPVTGDPDPKHISTSYVERQNLTMRMHMRRFTRLTNAFSKKFDNHVHMVALYTVWYNFVRIHKTLRQTPAMAAGLTDKLWDMTEIVKLIEANEMAETSN
ncbi:MAG TPA: IS1 family transposase, partial [Vicinamibacterales bacterium]